MHPLIIQLRLFCVIFCGVQSDQSAPSFCLKSRIADSFCWLGIYHSIVSTQIFFYMFYEINKHFFGSTSKFWSNFRGLFCSVNDRVRRKRWMRSVHEKESKNISALQNSKCTLVNKCLCVLCILTSTEYSTSSPSSPVSFSVYLAFFILASTGPFSTWCFKALNSLYRGSPAVS